jgi:hypothetical protein
MEADSEFVMPQRLLANAGISFNGSKIYGNGFLLNVDEAERIVAQDPRYEDVIMWYLTGQDLNNSPNCRPIKKVINFFDWPLERMKSDGSSTPVASDYPICLSIVRGTVKPERNHNNRKVRKEKWWQYGERASGLYSSISRLKWCICVAAAATKYTVFGRVSGRVVFSHSTSVVVSDSFAVLAILSCTVHEVWARAFGSHNLMLLRYSSSDLLGTFPFPISDIAYLATQKPELEAIGCSYDSYRSAIMTQRNEGLTETYNRFHDPNEYSTDIQKLRELHAEMDRAVVAAYGWTDLNLGHGLHATKQGVRFTISEPARRGILQCLLQLNHERYAEQSKHGGADAKKRRISKHKQSTGDGPPSTTEQPRLF